MATRIGEKEAPSPDKPLLMIVDLGQNPRELFALELELRRSNRFRLIRISELLRAGYPLSIPLGEGIRAAVLAAEQKSRQARAKYAGPYPFIFANRHLGFQFDGAWREVLRSCEVSAFFEPLLRQIRPDVVLLGADCFTAEGLIRDIAQRCGILVGSLLHSGLSPRRGWRELGSSADVVFTWGEIDRASLLDHGARPEQLASVGSLRYPRGTESLTHTSPEHRERVRTRLGIAQPRVVSFLTGATNFGLAVSSCQPRIHRDAFRAVLAWAESHPDVALLVKPHPSYDHLEWYRALSATFPGNVRLLEGESLADVVAVTDVPVLFNYCTTAALEPLVTAPIVYARIGYRTTPLLRSSIDDTVLAATNVPELVGHIERLLAPQSKLAEECLRRQKAFSRRMFGDLGRHPATVIADVLDERLAARHVEGLASPAPKGPVIDVSRQSAWLDELWRSGASSAVEQWGAVVRRTQGQDRTAFLLASAVTVGATAMAPEQIRAALRAFRSTATAEAGDLGRRFLTALCATAMIGAVGRHRWLDVVSLASDALRCSARDPTSMRLMVRLLGKAAISFGVSDARALFTLVGAATRLGDGSFA